MPPIRPCKLRAPPAESQEGENKSKQFSSVYGSQLQFSTLPAVGQLLVDSRSLHIVCLAFVKFEASSRNAICFFFYGKDARRAADLCSSCV